MIINPFTGGVVNDCGSGAGGFKPGNTCAKGGGSGGIGAKLAATVVKDIAVSGFTTEHNSFRSAYGDLDDVGKKAVVKDLSGRGLIHPVLARRKKPPTGSEVVDSVRDQAKIAIQKHSDDPLNRHVRFQDTDQFKMMTAD